MTQIIYKYRLPIKPDTIIIETPNIINILDVQLQNNIPVIWLLVDKDTSIRQLAVTCLYTGWATSNPIEIGDYLGTVQHGSSVLHYFLNNVK